MYRVMDTETILSMGNYKTLRGAKIVCNRLNKLMKMIGGKDDRFSIIYDEILK